MNINRLPNLICIVRIFLLVPVVILLFQSEFAWALLIFSIAAISDGVDGFLAKRFGWESALGSLLDPVADKLLLVSIYITFGAMGFLPEWLVAIVIIRDVIIVSGTITYYFKVGPFVGEPLFSSKINTVLQLSLVAAVLVNLVASVLPDQLLGYLIVSVLISTIWSGSMYIYIWCRRGRYGPQFNNDVKDFR